VSEKKPRTPKVEYPAREAALLWVPYNRAAAWGMAVSGAALIALASFNLATRTHPVVPVHIVTICVGSLLVLTGLRQVVRKTPVIAGDERGLVVSATGIDRSLLPWETVGGADVVGKGKNGRWLVILSEDAEGAMRHVHPSLVRTVRGQNKKWKRPGVVYVMAKILAEPPEVVAATIRGILGETDKTEMLVAGAPPTAKPGG
jgi:hypothetical protein